MGVEELAAFAGAYLVGSIPVGMLYLWFARVRIRRTRSGNIGASEIKDHLGSRAAAVVAFGIFLQGLLPPLIARLVTDSETLLAAAALGAIIGYGWQILPGLGGGRGVGVSTGAAVVISPLSMLPLLASYALGGLTKQMGLATIVGFAAYVGSVYYLTDSPALRIVASLIFLLLLVRRLDGVREDLKQAPAPRVLVGRLLFDHPPPEAE